MKSGRTRAISREIENTASSPKMTIVDMETMYSSRVSKVLTDRFLSKQQATDVFEIVKSDLFLRILGLFRNW